jgi:hypothetical protein
MELYRNRFELAVATVEMSKASLVEYPLLEKFEDDENNISDATKRKQIVRDKVLGMVYLINTDPSRFGTLWDELLNNKL